MKNWVVVLFAVLVLSACAQNPPPVQNLPDMTFQHLGTVKVPVADVDIINNNKVSRAGTEVSHRMTTSPLKAMKRWAQDRLEPTAQKGRAVFTILEASAVESKLKKEEGFSGIFSNDQSERYDLTVEARLDLYDGYGRDVGFATARAHRYVTVAEDTSLLELEKTWYNLLEKMMQDFDRAMMDNIRVNGLK